MKIVALVENTSLLPKYRHKHGLSFYVETENHKMLFDLGSNDLFLKNAEKLNIDINAVDVVIISHGHKDHGGALNLFLQKNNHAKVYLHKTAFDEYYTKMLGVTIPIGIDATLKTHGQVVLIDGEYIIDNEIKLFSGVTERLCYSTSNNKLFARRNSKMQLDDFRHEQNVIIHEKGKHTLIAGCAHNGIINIQNRAEQLIGKQLDFIISGFHLFNPVSKKCENPDLVKEITNKLKGKSTIYFTCHCTGEKAFDALRNILGDKISYLSAGSSIKI